MILSNTNDCMARVFVNDMTRASVESRGGEPAERVIPRDRYCVVATRQNGEIFTLERDNCEIVARQDRWR